MVNEQHDDHTDNGTSTLKMFGPVAAMKPTMQNLNLLTIAPVDSSTISSTRPQMFSFTILLRAFPGNQPLIIIKLLINLPSSY